MNWALILANCVVFYFEFTMPVERLEAFVGMWGVIPAAFHPVDQAPGEILNRIPTLFTAMFLHGGPGHLLGNMLFLWIFGDNIEDRLGHLGYIIFYLTCGVAASVVQIVANPESVVPMIGASGAIGGVMGAYMILYPHSQVLTLFFFIIFVRFIWVPALLYLGLWFVMQLLEALAAPPDVGAGIAFWAHVGGFVAGVGWVILLHIASLGRRRPRTA